MASLNVHDRARAGGRAPRHAAGDIVDGSGRSAQGSSPKGQSPPKRDCVDLLTRMVEGEIIPRLLLAHQNDMSARGDRAPRPEAEPGFTFGPQMVEHFAQMVLSSEIDALMDYLASHISKNVTAQSIYMDLLAPTARKLGDYWDQDHCSFADVTIALGRLQQILHELSRRSPQAQETQRRGRSVLLATAPSEQHTFGLLVIEEFFRRAGWRTWCEPCGDPADIAQMVSGQWYDLFGLSVSCSTHLDQVSAVITSVRRSSKNRSIRVIVGGRLFSEHPELAGSVGADVAASDGDEAVAKAESAIFQLEGRC